MATKKNTKQAAKKTPARRPRADADDSTPDPLAAAASRARLKAPRQQLEDDAPDLDDADDLDAVQDDADGDDQLDEREAADVPDYVTEAIEKQRAFATEADVEIVHMVYRHVGGTRNSARELCGRVDDLDVMEQADVGDRYGGGFYSVYSYYRRPGRPENRVAWTCRVSSSYQPKSRAARVAPGVALPSQLAESVALLDQLSIIAERMGGSRREQSPVEAMGKMMEGVMQVLGTTMRTAVKYQGDRALEQLRDGGAPAALPAAPAAGGFGLKDLFDAVGGVEGLMQLGGQLLKRVGTPPTPGDGAA